MLKIVPDPPALLDFLGRAGERAWPLRQICRGRQPSGAFRSGGLIDAH